MTDKYRIFPGAPFAAIGTNSRAGGRDFIVSDIHGRYAELVAELVAVRFNPSRDRLFSVGDLVDRGPQNLDCLGLLRQPWFKAVLGNHEGLLLTRRAGRPSRYHSILDAYNPRNGTGWLDGLSLADEVELNSLIPLLEACPLVMRVAHEAGEFNVTHAQLTRDRTSGFIREEHLLDEQLLEYAEPFLTWGRALCGEGRRAHKALTVDLGDGEVLEVTGNPFEPGVALTYCGHNRLKRSLLHRSHFHFDRGAAYMGPGERVLVLEHADVMRRLELAGVKAWPKHTP
ncbi:MULTISPECIES: metallophosphoesterase [unclassified Variovorax]|uniref:metallophosphoesterase n=1 Tax=unclassified Variovorax TaxID=663243 RepID=UPI001317E027|nr:MULTISPECIES: metallophosphoesterase [unclassified Variovorax]VTU42687.1 Serine/threonine-protein phosphatase 1 [Variovorax sp. PBL-H6]VTU43750.1 Serine/threonine-protein phosphatase 1 [Variovorax sp. SRS16]VTU43816.1 Serine/threonine-protein phosphatase 1 [Variovorax sp. PBL-E5]